MLGAINMNLYYCDFCHLELNSVIIIFSLHLCRSPLDSLSFSPADVPIFFLILMSILFIYSFCGTFGAFFVSMVTAIKYFEGHHSGRKEFEE